MKIPIYNINKPNTRKKPKKAYQHYIYSIDDRIWVIPRSFSKKTINPRNFFKLKNEYNIQKIIINDYIKPSIETICIIDHINKAGTNYLIGKTPFGGFSVFPDMCNIYNEIDGLKKATVQTVGPKRFLIMKENPKTLISHSSGLTAPIWHYVGAMVYAQNNFKDSDFFY